MKVRERMNKYEKRPLCRRTSLLTIGAEGSNRESFSFAARTTAAQLATIQCYQSTASVPRNSEFLTCVVKIFHISGETSNLERKNQVRNSLPGLKGRPAGPAAIPIVFIRSVHHRLARNSQRSRATSLGSPIAFPPLHLTAWPWQDCSNKRLN